MNLSARLYRRKAMTLLELLLVMAIMGTLLTLSTPMITSISESNNLTNAGQILSDQIRLGTQIASSRNKVIEVRLLKVSQITTSSANYRGIQLWMSDSNGAMKAIDKMVSFPTGIVISESPNFSPLLTMSGISSGTISYGNATNNSYVAFKIHPSGFFEPVPDDTTKSQLYVTLLNNRFTAASSLPFNYVTVQISPYTCATTIYRP